MTIDKSMSSKKKPGGVSRSASILSAISMQEDMDMEREGGFCLRPSSFLKIGDKVSLMGESDTGVRGFISTLGYVTLYP